MALILPSYMVHTLHFSCKRCGLNFNKQTPSKVEKCPMCDKKNVTVACIAKGFSKDKLDNYSLSKLRWYSDPTGERHRDEIRHRKTKKRDGKEVVLATDSKGRTIEEYINPVLPEKEVTFKNENIQKIK